MTPRLRADGEAGCCCAICLICLKIMARKVVMETRRISVLQGGNVMVSLCIYSGMDADQGSASRDPELHPTP